MSTDSSMNANNNAYEASKVEVIVLAKSDKTLKNNMDAKDETMRKRTSLIIVPQLVDALSDRENNLTNSTIDNDNCNETVDSIRSDDSKTTQTNDATKQQLLEASICSTNSNAGTEDDEVDDVDYLKKSLDNDNKRNRHSIASVDSCVSRSTRTSSTDTSTSSGDDVAIDDYNDLEENGNLIDDLDDGDRKNCLSNASSSIDDYSLREKLHNYVNEALVKDEGSTCGDQCTSSDADEVITEEMEAIDESVEEEEADVAPAEPQSLPPCDALLSPQEVPMGRRYAEVAQFKANKW